MTSCCFRSGLFLYCWQSVPGERRGKPPEGVGPTTRPPPGVFPGASLCYACYVMHALGLVHAGMHARSL